MAAVRGLFDALTTRQALALNRTGESETQVVETPLVRSGVLTVVRLLEFGRWDVTAGFVESAVVNQSTYSKGGDLDLVDAAPRAAAFDQFGLEQADLAD